MNRENERGHGERGDSSSSSFSSPSSSSCSGVAASALTTQLLQDGKKVEPETKLQNQDSRIDRSLPEVPSSSTDKFTHGIHCADFLKLIEHLCFVHFSEEIAPCFEWKCPCAEDSDCKCEKTWPKVVGCNYIQFRSGINNRCKCRCGQPINLVSKLCHNTGLCKHRASIPRRSIQPGHLRKKVMLHFNEIRRETNQDKKGELFAKTISVIGEHIVELCKKLNIYVGLSSPPTLASSLSTPPSQPDLVASPTSSISSFSSCNAEMLEFLQSKFGPNYSPCDFIDVERYACYAMRKPRYELRQVKNLLRDVHVVTSQPHCNDGQACWISYRANLYSRVFHMCVDPFLRPQLIPSVTPHGSPDSCPLVICHGICEEGNGYHPSCCRPSHMQLGNSRINNTESQKKRHISSNIHTPTPIDHTPIRVLSSSSDIGPPAPFPSPSPPRTDSLSTSSSASASSSHPPQIQSKMDKGKSKL